MIGFPIFGFKRRGISTLGGEDFGGRAVESHVSPKTSEIWGTQVLLWGKVVRALMGLRPVFINPRTLVRTWGTQTGLR
jgi:hypothetical protein